MNYQYFRQLLKTSSILNYCAFQKVIGITHLFQRFLKLEKVNVFLNPYIKKNVQNNRYQVEKLSISDFIRIFRKVLDQLLCTFLSHKEGI